MSLEDWQAVGDDLRQAITEVALLRGICLERIIDERDKDHGVFPPPIWIERLEWYSAGSAEDAFKRMVAIGDRRRREEASRIARGGWFRRLHAVLVGLIAGAGAVRGNKGPR